LAGAAAAGSRRRQAAGFCALSQSGEDLRRQCGLYGGDENFGRQRILWTLGLVFWLLLLWVWSLILPMRTL
jgi:hypothetical protein